jgi:hypothetical protein
MVFTFLFETFVLLGLIFGSVGIGLIGLGGQLLYSRAISYSQSKR